jgi:hypothetical protein
MIRLLREDEISSDEPEGVGGLMWLPILGLALVALSTFWDLLLIVISLDDLGSLFVASDERLVVIRRVLIGTVVTEFLIGASAVVALILIFLRSAMAPGAALAHYVLLAGLMLSQWLLDIVLAGVANLGLNEGIALRFAVAFAMACAGTAYFLLSRRVRNTFRKE